jgi:hypothetical protein
MPVQKKSSSVIKKTVKKTVVKKTSTPKPSSKKTIKKSTKPKEILSHIKESDFKKFVAESDNYQLQDSFEPVSENDSDEVDQEIIDQEEVEQEEFVDNENKNEEKIYNRDDYDFQKKFYNNLAKEAKERGDEELSNHSR